MNESIASWYLSRALQEKGDIALTWVDAQRWSDRWEKVTALQGGGQGDVFQAKRISDGRPGFLKTIKGRNDPERRARFFREANAYDTFRVNGIPSLIESNAHRHSEEAFSPFIVTEFIAGPTLREWREATQSVSLEAAVTVAIRLLEIVQGCHAAGCVHRDIKPDNIILEGGDTSRPWLLDFGLNHHDIPISDFMTEDRQELGNRFLRLPELSAGSLLKQDPRSDVSFVGGILFYILTGEHPDVLQDAEGSLPHQRPRVLAALKEVAASRFLQLSALFDHTFAPLIANRFPNCQAMSESIYKVMENQQIPLSTDGNLSVILALVKTPENMQQIHINKKINDALSKVYQLFSEIQQSLSGALILSQTGYGVDGLVGSNTLFWTRPGLNKTILSTTYEVYAVGTELVFRFSGEVVLRTNLFSPDYGDDFRERVRSWVLTKIRSAIDDPGQS